MLEKPVLPIDDLSIALFNNEFKEKYLDSKVLSEEALNKIKELFMVGYPNPKAADVRCCEYHPHDYTCVYFNHPATGIVDRLIMEIDRYKHKLSEIEELTKDR